MKVRRGLHYVVAVMVLVAALLPHGTGISAEDIRANGEIAGKGTRRSLESDIDVIMSDALLVEHLASSATVDVAGIVADADYSAVNQHGYAVWDRPLYRFSHVGQTLTTLGVTIRYAISPGGDFHVGSKGSPSAALAVLVGHDEQYWVTDLSLRDILLYGYLEREYARLTDDGYVSGGDGLDGPVSIQNNYGERIQIMYSALMMATTYNGEFDVCPECFDVWDPSGPGATSYTGDTWRKLDVSYSGNTHSLVFSQCYNDNENSTYIKHDGATVVSRGTLIGPDDDVRLDEYPASIEMGGTRTWSALDASLHVIVVGGSISSSNYAEYPADGGNPTPSVLTIPPSSALDESTVYLPLVTRMTTPAILPQVTDEDGTVVFPLPQANVQVTIQDTTGQPVQGMRVSLVSSGEKVLMVAEDPEGRYVPTFRESVLPQTGTTASTLDPASSAPLLALVEAVHLAVEGKSIYDLGRNLPDLTEYNLAYDEVCWDVDQLALALSITGGLVGTVFGPVVGAVVGIGAHLALPDLLTDLWCARSWDSPTIMRSYHFPLLQGKLYELRGPCPNRPPEDICSASVRETAMLTGIVRNARTGSGIEGATVRVEPEGPAAGTDSSGGYTMTAVPKGYHTVVAGKDGYVSQAQLAYVDPVSGGHASFELSPVGSGDEYRFVLTWDADPRDLDSHLWLPAAHPYHIYFSNKGELDEFPYAALDLDDTTSYGPETTTVIRSYDGAYTYAVYLYAGSGSLTTSGAQVNIYRGDTLLRQVQVPTSGSGRWWIVADIDGTQGGVTVYNYIIDSSPAPY